MLIPTTCLFVLSLTIVPPFNYPAEAVFCRTVPCCFIFRFRFTGTVFFAVPSAVTAIFWDGQHRLRFRNGSPTALPALSFPCLRLLSLCLRYASPSYMHSGRPREPQDQKDQNGMKSGLFIDPASEKHTDKDRCHNIESELGDQHQVFESVFFLTHFLPPHLPRNAYRHYTKYLRICPFLRINFTDIS